MQVVNRPLNTSDEDILIVSGIQSWSVRNDLLKFPQVIPARSVKLIYHRSYGEPAVVLLFMYHNRQ